MRLVIIGLFEKVKKKVLINNVAIQKILKYMILDATSVSGMVLE